MRRDDAGTETRPGDPAMGHRIATARGWRKLTQAELAAQMLPPHSGAWLANIELGKRHILADDLGELASLLDVPVSYLYGDIEAFLTETGVQFDAAVSQLSEGDLETIARLVQTLAHHHAQETTR